MLVRLLYASRPIKPMAGTALSSFLETSVRRNKELGITGVLAYVDDAFIQLLEGGRDPVCMLYNDIISDGRHADVRLLVYEEIAERKFTNWIMGQVEIEHINPMLLLKYFEDARLSPLSCSGQATMALLEELVTAAYVS